MELGEEDNQEGRQSKFMNNTYLETDYKFS